MSNEVILNLSFDNQTVTDLTGNWTLDGTPNATYEQIDGRDGYSLVTGSLGRCIVLNAVDQNAVYNEYTVDFDMFIKSTYTSNYYFYYVNYLWSRINPGNSYNGKIGDVLDIYLQIGGSDQVGTTNYSPIGRWVHVTFTSGPTGVGNQYCTTVYVDGVKLIDRTDGTYSSGDNNPFALSQQIIPLARDTDAKLMPNGPGICLNTFKVVTGIHIPDQNPAISLFNLNRVFNNFCTWLKGKLSTVAFTGSYNDLRNKPTISTVNDGTLTIQQNGTNVQTFTANASTNKTANIQCVDLSTAQTIGGIKKFSNIPIVVNGKTYVSQINASRADGTQTGFSAYNGFKIVCNNDSQAWDNTAFALHIPEYSPTSATVAFKLYDCIEGSASYKGFLFKKNNNDFQFSPTASNLTDLGSSTNKWKSFNGINPGALSLPSNSYVNVDTTNWVLDGSNVNIFTPASDGWLGIQVTDTVYDQMHYVFVGRTGGGSAYYQQNVLSPINALWNGEYHGCVFIPVIKNFNYDIRCICSTIVATFYPCQGNV